MKSVTEHTSISGMDILTKVKIQGDFVTLKRDTFLPKPLNILQKNTIHLNELFTGYISIRIILVILIILDKY